MTNGEVVKYEASEVSYIDFQVVKTVQPVDLGLSSGTLWSPVNLGANSEEESGDYYAWAETSTKESFTTENYAYYYKENNVLKVTDIGTTNIAGMEAYDAATAQWGNGWQMPTSEQFIELKSECTSELVQINGINGWRFTGPNGNSIFIPLAGRHYQKNAGEPSSLDNVNNYGYYRSANRDEYYELKAESFYIGKGGMMKMNSFGRDGGHTIRPVKMVKTR